MLSCSLFNKPKQPELRTFKSKNSDNRKEYFELQITRTLSKSLVPSGVDTQAKTKRLLKVAEYIEIAKIQKALVIGCRNSTELDLLEASGAKEVAAIDLVSADPRIIVCDMHDITIADTGEYDFVFCSHALEHALDYIKALREIHRVLPAGGMAFFEVPTQFSPSGADLHDFSNAQHLRNIIESVFGSIEVLYIEDLSPSEALCGTHVARILFKTLHTQVLTRPEEGKRMKRNFVYSEMLRRREECVRRFGGVFSLPVVAGAPFNNALLGQISRTDGNMLDFGSGPQRLKSVVTGCFPGMTYYSLDADATYGCDWTNIGDIPEDIKFSLICADQVLEHIPLEAAVNIFPILGEKLVPGGIFYATVPNIAHPNRFLSDIEHCTYVKFTDLYYYCSLASCETIFLFRYSKRHPHGFLERFIARRIQDIYRMDWADSIGIIARKTDKVV